MADDNVHNPSSPSTADQVFVPEEGNSAACVIDCAPDNTHRREREHECAGSGDICHVFFAFLPNRRQPAEIKGSDRRHPTVYFRLDLDMNEQLDGERRIDDDRWGAANRDTLANLQPCKRAVECALRDGKSVLVHLKSGGGPLG